MLVLSREKDERVIGYANVGELRKALAGLRDDEDVNLFDIIVSRFNGTDSEHMRARLGFECPRVIKVMREEVLRRYQATGVQRETVNLS